MEKRKVVYNASEGGGLHLSEEAVAWLKERGLNVDDYPVIRGKIGRERYGPYWTIPRHTPLLVECIEALGEKANGSYSLWTPEADFRIFKITGEYYYINEHDGAGEEVIDITKMTNSAE